MKRKSLLTVLSVLLCASTLLVGCGDDASTSSSENKPASMTEASGFVGTKLSDYVLTGYKAETAAEFEDPTLLSEKYGTLDRDFSDFDAGLLIFKKTDKDFLNNVTETFTVYNAEKGKVVLETKNVYEDGDFSDDKMQPSDMDVYVGNLRYDSGKKLPYIAVATYKFTEIDEEIVEENELDFGYTSSTLYEYYDVAGTKIASTPISSITPEAIFYKDSLLKPQLKAVFASTVAVFDVETSEVISTYGVTENKLDMFDFETEQYGYYFNNTMMSMMGGSGSTGGKAVEVYDKASGELVYSYMQGAMEMTMAHGLQSGAVLLQSLNFSDIYEMMENYETPFDVELNVTTKLIDVAAKTTKEIECDYFFETIVSADDFAQFAVPAANEEMTITENVKNIAIGINIEKAQAGGFQEMQDDAIAIMFLDNAANVEYVANNSLTFGDSVLEFPEKLATGDYYYDVSSDAPDGVQGIILKEDGTIRRYVPTDADIVGEWIIADRTIYDFDGNVIERLDFSYGEEHEWQYVNNLGETLIFERTYNTTSNGETVTKNQVCFVKERVNYGYHDEDDETKFEYKVLDNARVYRNGDGSEDYAPYLYDDCVVVYNDYYDEYRIYDADGDRVLSLNDFEYMYEADGGYVVVTDTETAEFDTAVYLLNTKTNNEQEGGDK